MIVSDYPTSYSHLVSIPMYATLPLCLNPGTHYFQADHIQADTAVCTRCGLIRKTPTR